MIIVFIIVCFTLAFMSGAHWSLWDQNGREGNGIYWSVALGLLYLWNVISLVGFLTKG